MRKARSCVGHSMQRYMLRIFVKNPRHAPMKALISTLPYLTRRSRTPITYTRGHSSPPSHLGHDASIGHLGRFRQALGQAPPVGKS